MEKSEVGVSKDDRVLVSSLDTLGIHDTSTWGGEISDTTLVGTVDVVGEGEESVAGASNTIKLLSPFLLLLLCERLWYLFKQALPLSALTTLEDLSRDEEIDGVGLVSALDALLKWQSEDAGVVTEPPEVGFTSGKTCAVNAGLLASTDTNDSTVIGIGDAVGLGVLEGQSGNDEIGDGALRKVLVLRHNVVEQLSVNLGVVALLLEVNTVDLLGLNLGGNVVGVDLEDTIFAGLLLFEDVKRFVGVSGCNHTIGNLTRDDFGSCEVARGGESNEVSE